MADVCIVYTSGTGYTALLAEAVHEGAKAQVPAKLIRTEDFSSAESGPWDELAASKAIIFGSPTYFGSVSAEMKRFVDLNIANWYQQSWAGKLAAGFTVSASPSGDKLGCLSSLSIFAAQMGMLWVPVGLLPSRDEKHLNRWSSFLGVMGVADYEKSEQGLFDGDAETARHLGKHVAKLAEN